MKYLNHKIKGNSERYQQIRSFTVPAFRLGARLGLTLCSLSLLLLAGCALPGFTKNNLQDDLSKDTSRNQSGFRRSVYASSGVGASRLTPDNEQIPTWNVSDRVNAGGQISIGADINRHVSLELHSADLGSAGVEKFGGSVRGRINYHMQGGSVLWYAGKNRHNIKRRGLSGYGRAGVARMNNSPVGNAPFSQRHATQLLVGAGLEFATKVGLGLRAEVISFDSDAQYAQLGVIYRLGQKPKRVVVPVFEARREKMIAPIPTLAAARISPRDSDNDGVVDSKDQCPSTRAGVVVDSEGCAVFDGVLKGVNFFSTSDQLTPQAARILDGVAQTLKQYPRAKIKVMAHTDSQGSEVYNQSLSTRRANMVVKYLTYKGIDKEVLSPAAFGESQPIATNDTPQGRALNRRVELRAVQ